MYLCGIIGIFAPNFPFVLSNITSQLNAFLKFVKSIDFSRGVLMAIAAVTSLTAANFFGNIGIGVAMAIGALVCSPSDVTGSFRRRTLGMFISILLAVFATLVAGYAAQNIFVFVPVLALLMFSLSMISVYGFRASLIAFSGMFAVVLSMANVPSGDSVLIHSLWIGLGGIWYLVLSLLLYFINPGKQAEVLLSEAFKLTSEYLKTRAEMLGAASEERKELGGQLSKLQSDINEKHENIRELVISRRVTSGKSGDARRKMLIFIELVDILELSMANPVNYERMNDLLGDHQQKLGILREWSFLLANELVSIAEAVEKNKKFLPNPSLETIRLKAKMAMHQFEEEKKEPIVGDDAILVLRNLMDFKEKQQEKIISIARLLKEGKPGEDLAIKNKEALKFITGQEYSFKTLQDNLDFGSPIFRHSLRLTVVILAGYFIGTFFELQNTYWILLTTLVIMRPGYALTKERSKQRLYGTLIGGALAISVVFLTQNVVLYAVLSIITLILALSMLQRNYRASAVFITLNIVFVYSLMTPDPYEVIRFRLMDTLIGGGLAFLGNSFLWPTWEYKGIGNFIVQSIKANASFLGKINNYYQKKEEMPSAYKLARKQAFLAIGNLNAAFQRMTQEPKSQQKDMGRTYRIVSLNQEFLSSAASLGAFIRTHSTTEASNHFKTYVSAIQENLSYAVNILEKENVQENENMQQIEKASAYFEEKYKELYKARTSNLEAGQTEMENDLRNKFQELQLVRDQLKWLHQISENLKLQVSSPKT